MRRALLLLAVALPAAAQTPSEPATPKPPELSQPPRPLLNLRLEDSAPSAAPRITFTPRDPAAEKAPDNGLPALGGAPSRAFDGPTAPGAKGSPFPADTNPGH